MAKHNWSEIIKDFGMLTDKEIAEKHSINNYRVVAGYRLKHGIQACTKWSRHIHLLGVISDRELATIVGVTPNAITQKRRRERINYTKYIPQESEIRDLGRF